MDEVVVGQYTTKTYEKALKCRANATAIIENKYADLSQIEFAKKEYLSAVAELKLAQDGKYRFDLITLLKYNDYVGNEWEISCFYNNTQIKSGDDIVIPMGAEAVIKIIVVEKDDIAEENRIT